MSVRLKEILTKTNNLHALVIPGLHDARIMSYRISEDRSEAELEILSEYGTLILFKMRDLRRARIVSWGFSAIINDIYMFSLQNKVTEIEYRPDICLGVLFDGDSGEGNSPSLISDFQKENVDAYYMQLDCSCGGVYAFAFGDISLEQTPSL